MATRKTKLLYFCTMSDITLQIPGKMDLDPKDTVTFLSAKLFESGRLSLAEAAELSGLSKLDFAETIGDYDVTLHKN